MCSELCEKDRSVEKIASTLQDETPDVSITSILMTKQKDDFDLAAMAFGVATPYIGGYICGILAIIFALVSRSKGNWTSQAKAGLICGIVGMIVHTLFLIAGLFFIFFMFTIATEFPPS